MAQFWIPTNIDVTVSLSLDMNAMTQLGAVKGVFQAQVGIYSLTFNDAQRLCALLGATLATYDQLYTAWEAGLQRCRYGLFHSSIVVFIIIIIIFYLFIFFFCIIATYFLCHTFTVCFLSHKGKTFCRLDRLQMLR